MPSSSSSEGKSAATLQPRLRGNVAMWHVLAMLGLYVGQGFLQGLCVTVGTLLMEARELSLDESTALSGTRIAFSLKFLWAPLLDGLYLKLRTRRPLWIAGTQLLLLGCFAWMWHRCDVLTQADGFRELMFLVYTTATLSATQDVAVDAWAVEGVPAHFASVAPTVQTIGLLSGIGITKIAVVLVGWSWLSVEAYFSCLVYVYVIVFAGLCVYLRTRACGSALDLAEDAARAAPIPTCLSVLTEVGGLIREHAWCRGLCVVLVLAAFHSAASTVVGVQAVTHLGFSASFFAELALMSMPVAIAASAYASGWIARQPASVLPRAWASLLLVDWTLCAVQYSMYAVLDGQSAWSRYGLTALSLTQAAFGNFCFVVVMTVISQAGRRAPGSVGTAMTLLSSMSNMSASLFGTGASWLLARLLPKGTAHDASFMGFERHVVAFYGLAGLSLVGGLASFFTIVRPALRRVGAGLSTDSLKSS